jgi:hypothetical protein
MFLAYLVISSLIAGSLWAGDAQETGWQWRLNGVTGLPEHIYVSPAGAAFSHLLAIAALSAIVFAVQAIISALFWYFRPTKAGRAERAKDRKAVKAKAQH